MNILAKSALLTCIAVGILALIHFATSGNPAVETPIENPPAHHPARQVHDAKQAVIEIHGNLPVNLVKKFSLNLRGTTGIAWSPDGKTLAVISDAGRKLNTFDDTGKPLSDFDSVTKFPTYWGSLAFLNGSSQILYPETDSSNIAALDIGDVATGNTVMTINTKDASNPNRSIYFAVSPDQKRIAFAPGSGTGVAIFHTENGQDWNELSVITSDHNLRSPSLSFFPDSTSLAMERNDGTFAVVDSTSGAIIREYKNYSVPQHVIVDGDAVAVSPKGDLIMTALGSSAKSILPTMEKISWELSQHAEISIWRVSDGKKMAMFPDKGGRIILNASAAWDPMERFVAFVDRGGLTVWQPNAPGEVYARIKLTEFTHALEITRDGKLLAVYGDNDVSVFSIENN